MFRDDAKDVFGGPSTISSGKSRAVDGHVVAEVRGSGWSERWVSGLGCDSELTLVSVGWRRLEVVGEMCLVGRPMSVMAPESVGERRQSAASLAKKIAEWTRTMLIRVGTEKVVLRCLLRRSTANHAADLNHISVRVSHASPTSTILLRTALLVPAVLRRSSVYKLIFDVVEEAYESDKTAISRVLKGVRDEAISVQLDANRRIDVKLHLYEWLANSAPASLTDNRLSHAREEVCRMIGPNFRVLKYEAAMKKYV
ncbi:hypothetical protein KCU62_g138, partial [Aureobasidium sp. EXF-3399]